MQLRQEKEKTINVKAPNTLVISAFASTENVKNAVKPIFTNDPDTSILYIDLAPERMRMGGSALSQVIKNDDTECPKVENIIQVKKFFGVL